MDESRKQFEAEVFRRAEISGCAHMSSVLKKTSDGGYATTWVDMMWEGWQASRAAIELDIDWPEANDDTWMEGEDGAYARGHEDGKDKVVIAVRQAIRAAGIKVKE